MTENHRSCSSWIAALSCPGNVVALVVTGVCVVAALASSSCSAVREARLGREEAIQPRVVQRITTRNAGVVEVRCGLGDLCAEIEVRHVQRRADGPVDVTLVNRTEEHVAVQLALESFDDHDRRTDRSGFHDIVLAPRGEGVLALSTSAAISDLLVLHLRPRTL